MIDLGGWAQQFGAALAGMMTTRHAKQQLEHGDYADGEYPSEMGAQRELNDAMVGSLRRWIHPSITVAISIFAFQQYEASQHWRSETETKIAVNTERLAELRINNDAQDRATQVVVLAINHRLDQQREDIRKAQQQIIDHMTHDEQRFSGRAR